MQQVNLYLQEFRPKFDPLSARPLLALAVVWVLGIVFYGSALSQKNAELISQEAALKEQIQLTETKLASIKNLSKPVDKSQMEAAVAQVQLAIQNREFAKRLIDSKGHGNDQGFSQAMLAIAKSSINDVFLQEFALENAGKDLTLKGLARRVDAAPEYLRQLQTHAAFKSTRFGVVSLEKAARVGEISFRIGQPEKTEGDTKTAAVDRPLPTMMVPMTPVGALMPALAVPPQAPVQGAK
jgi:MSHA biogenesis protein MshI